MATEETKIGEIQVGVPISEFEAAVDTLQALQREGKYQVFLPLPISVRLIGDNDQFRVSLSKRLGPAALESKRADDLLEEVRMVFQLVVATEKITRASRFLEENVYDDEFDSAKEDPELQKRLRETIAKKVELVFNKLTSEAMRERAKRLSTTLGPLLQDLDFELVSERRSSAGSEEASSPFLRLRLRYAMGGEINPPFFFPPWIANPPVKTTGFELECDETDIDLLFTRLLQAKELLRKAIEAKIEPEKK